MKQFIKCPECGKVQLKYLIHPHQMIRCDSCQTEANIALWDVLRALSIKQPWAWLIVNGFKDIENRDNLKNFTGDFLVHAGASYDYDWILKFNRTIDSIFFLGRIKLVQQNKGLIQSGGIIGYATITGFVEKSDSPWFVGKYGLLIKDAKPLPFTPCKGKLSFFKPEIA